MEASGEVCTSIFACLGKGKGLLVGRPFSLYICADD
jgi:hypothetical protein